MSFEVSALKYRPHAFSSLLGQKQVSQTLMNALMRDQVPHALLFTGPRGTGKTSSARIVAKSVKCLTPKNNEPCNTCSQCISINDGSNLDVREIDGASHNGVDSVRELIENVQFRPTFGDKKIYIIDEVHMLSGSAFNALLKTLEEPPDHVIFIMATTEAHKIPKTVLSRCQRFDFKKVSLETIVDHLKHICTDKGFTFEDRALWLVARQGEGSVRDTLSLFDQVISYVESNITVTDVQECFGVASQQSIHSVLKAIFNQDSQEVIGQLEKVITTGIEPKLFIQEFLNELRNLIYVKVLGEESMARLNYNSEEYQSSADLVASIDKSDLHFIFDLSLKGQKDVMYAPDAFLVLEIFLLKLTEYEKLRKATVLTQQSVYQSSNQGATQSRRQASAVQEPATQIAQQRPVANKPQTQRQPAPAPRAQATQVGQVAQTHSQPTETVSSVSATGEKTVEQFVLYMKKLNPMTASLLENCHMKINEPNIEIYIGEKSLFIREKLSSAQEKKKIKNYAKMFFDEDYEVKIMSPESGDKKKTLVQSKQDEKEQKVKDDRKRILNHPDVKYFVEKYKAQVEKIVDLAPVKEDITEGTL